MSLANQKVSTAKDYWNLPEGKRAELIDGQLYMMSPPSRLHQKLVMEIAGEIRNHVIERKGSCEVYPAPFAVNLDAADYNWVEPDITVICDKDKLNDKGCKGAPDWVIEIVSPSSVQMDYYTKLILYKETGVREYWIVNPKTETVLVYDFEHGEPQSYKFSEDIKGTVLKQLVIHINKLLNI